MEKIWKTILSVILVFGFGRVICLFVPLLEKPMFLLFDVLWKVFRDFFLWDILEMYVLYIVLFVISLIVLGHVSKHKKNVLWKIVSVILKVA